MSLLICQDGTLHVIFFHEQFLPPNRFKKAVVLWIYRRTMGSKTIEIPKDLNYFNRYRVTEMSSFYFRTRGEQKTIFVSWLPHEYCVTNKWTPEDNRNAPVEFASFILRGTTKKLPYNRTTAARSILFQIKRPWLRYYGGKVLRAVSSFFKVFVRRFPVLYSVLYVYNVYNLCTCLNNFRSLLCSYCRFNFLCMHECRSCLYMYVGTNNSWNIAMRNIKV